MGTTKSTIEGWLAKAGEGATHMIVACDTFDYVDYPVYCSSDEACLKKFSELSNEPMTKVMEVYDLRLDHQEQLDSQHAMNLPKA